MKAYDSLSTFPDVEPALKKLSANPTVICVVFSNGTKEMVANSVLKSANLSPHASVFEKLVTVDFVQAFKPAPEVYKHLAQAMDMVGREDAMWLVSSNPFDVTGARAVGMKAAWVDRAGTGWQDNLGLGQTVVVRNLEEVAGVVEEHDQKTG
jgi:2-haloacid dehalogenase